MCPGLFVHQCIVYFVLARIYGAVWCPPLQWHHPTLAQGCLAQHLLIPLFIQSKNPNRSLLLSTLNWTMQWITDNAVKLGYRLQCPVWDCRSKWMHTHHILLHAASAPSSFSYSSAALPPDFTSPSNAHVTGNLRLSTDSQSVEVS